MKAIFVTVTTAVVLVVNSMASAQLQQVEKAPVNGEINQAGKGRKGFILGLGLGGAVVSFRQNYDYVGSRWIAGDHDKLAVRTDFRIGYAFNDRFMLYWMWKDSWFQMKSQLVRYDGRMEVYYVVDISDDLGVSGTRGFCMSYFFRSTAPSAYLVAGIGGAYLGSYSSSKSGLRGATGITCGIGHEFRRHWTMEATATYATSDRDGVELNLWNFGLTVGWLHY